MNSFNFTPRAFTFVDSCIRQRVFLVKNGKSKNPVAAEEAEFLAKHLRAYPNRTSLQMARFIINNRERIRTIIPGNSSGLKLHDQFNQLLSEAEGMVTTSCVRRHRHLSSYSHRLIIR